MGEKLFKMNLFLISNPFQFLSAMEAIYSFRLEKNLIIIFEDKFNNNSKQLNNLLNENSNFFIDIIKIENKRTKFFKYIKTIYNLKNKLFEKIFIGDLGSIQKVFISNINAKKIFLLDDGAKTILIHKKMKMKIDLFPQDIKLLRYKILGLRTNIKSNISFFTLFNLNDFGNLNIIKHSFNYLKKINNFETKKISNKIFILGQPIVENNRVEKSTYENYLNKIISHYSNCDILYLMHRREDIKNLNSYKLSKNIEIIKSELPGEIYFTKLDFMPKAIVGINTTLIFSLNVIFDKINVIAYTFESKDILKSKEWFEEAIKYFHQNNIKILKEEKLS